MKYRSYLFGIIVSLLAYSMQVGRSDAISQGDQAKLDSVTDRVRAGDNNALFEVSNMPASIAVPYLGFWADTRRSAGERSKMASEALRQVQGYADYLRNDMAAATNDGHVPESDFEILEAIATAEAAALAAPYLFDFKTVAPQDRDLAGDSNLEEAIYRLGRMNLPDAPPPQSPRTSNSAYLMQWQRWAIAKGFVPQSWSSRVGAPASWLKLDAMERPAPPPVAAKTSQPFQTTASSSSIGASSLVPSNALTPAVARSTEETKAHGHTFGMLLSVLLALVIIGGIFAWKRRS